MTQGRFITLDGSEGAGKSTQICLIQTWLHEHNIPAWITREPGGTATGERIRDILLDPQAEIDPDTELLLVMAARKQHLNEAILPRLARGEWVICDRFNDATYAYQGYGRGISLTRIASLEQWVMEGIEPDLRLILGVDKHTALERMNKRGASKDRFEREQNDFFSAVAQGFHARANADNARWIDANGSEEETFNAIRPHLEALR